MHVYHPMCSTLLQGTVSWAHSWLRVTVDIALPQMVRTVRETRSALVAGAGGPRPAQGLHEHWNARDTSVLHCRPLWHGWGALSGNDRH